MNKRAKKISQFLALLVLTQIFSLKAVLSQSITQAIDSTGTLVTSPNSNPNQFDITGGTRSGVNLFQSFQQFSLSQNQTANFLSSPSIENILGRVVGGNASVIDGQIQVTGGNSNLYLLNPAGIIFGTHASLNVPASFAATSANAIGISNQWFKAIGSNNYATLAGSPNSFAFSTPDVGSIVNVGNLTVPSGQNLILLGGTVINTGTLSAPFGTITIATVPGENLVHISQSGNLLSLDLPVETKTILNTNSQPLTPLSLPQLLTGGNSSEATEVMLNSQGQAVLSRSGIPVNRGDVVATNQVTTGTATLLASHNLTLVESQVRTTGDLNLVALDTVRIRDSVTKPFVAHAQGNINIWGKQGIDILALNHPQTPFQSGGDIRLVSNGTISGDAHFASGGNFSIRNLVGSPGIFVSQYDPIISSVGDVDFGDYTGVSLKIEALGDITAGNITITGPDTMLFGNDPDIPILTSSPALILRAGLSRLENPPNVGQGSYSITNLGTLGGGSSAAYSINNSGQVVGQSRSAYGLDHIFLWENGVMRDLGGFNSYSSPNIPTSINDLGQVVGYSYTIYSAVPFPTGFLWQNGVVTTLAGINPINRANSINNSGQVVGLSGYASLWENGVIRDLGSLDRRYYSEAYGINNIGQVVGISGVAVLNRISTHAFLWENGVMRDLGTLGGSNSGANSINDSGQVVGYSQTSSGKSIHAFLWQNGVMKDLGTLGDSSSQAQSINNSSQIVGSSSTTSGDERSFLWQNGMMTDLNSLLPSNSGWNRLTSANDINDIGQIVGTGQIGDQSRAFLMTPNTSGSGLQSRGSITVGNISTPGGPVIMSANSDINLRGSISTQGGTISLTPNIRYRDRIPQNLPDPERLRRTPATQQPLTDSLEPLKIDSSAVVHTPGLLQHNPVLSAANSQGVFAFIEVPTRKWYGLPVASGLEYQMTSTSLFTEIAEFPKGIDADNRFTVSVEGRVIGEFSPGDRIVFSNYRQLLGDLLVEGKGVLSFTVTGIEPLADASASTTFPLKLEFDTPTASFEVRLLNTSSEKASLDAES